MSSFPPIATVQPLRRRRNFLFLGIADDAFDGLEDWMVAAGETPATAHKRSPRARTP